MRSYWIWLLALITTWAFALPNGFDHQTEVAWRIAISAGFFAIFFLAPLFQKKPVILMILLIAASIFAIVGLWPGQGEGPNPFILLVYSIIAGKAVYRLPWQHALLVGIILFSGAIIQALMGQSAFLPVFIVLYACLIALAFAVYKKTRHGEEEALLRNDALLTEYRKMKRRLTSNEEVARQEERTQIAREIHDAVGHQLTGLLMQLEVFRMQADENMKGPLGELKNLARESLEETRRAVRTLKQDEISGLSAVIGLIRKLEAESFIRVQFSVKHGAFSAPLDNRQIIAVYRAVQEALTNVMRHSEAREAEILFEAPGGSIFRFEVSNPIKEHTSFREGFGLISMSERLEQVGGQLEVVQDEDRFVVRGTLSMRNKERVG
ncbi:sensor histidine kinase [Desmospora profundinema]|uniref:histidine kinase n=1 Tax=Desmospora profundinema TaxID=1571184 RepID=A0ABU1IJB4_9BACL|nr:sensor histidine kinase [Desmospora profundinema]MDR6224846.1 signal transduction histidine kinase [Desmospora profundinema]